MATLTEVARNGNEAVRERGKKADVKNCGHTPTPWRLTECSDGSFLIEAADFVQSCAPYAPPLVVLDTKGRLGSSLNLLRQDLEHIIVCVNAHHEAAHEAAQDGEDGGQ